MSPRRTGRRRDDDPVRPPGGADATVEDWRGLPYLVRPVAGAAARKTYRCPGCDHEVRSGTPHLVVWPEGGESDRRHWHTPCWRARERRGGRA